MPVIGSDEQNKLVGGYTFSEYENMVSLGSWTGGYVDGMGCIGYTCSDVNVYATLGGSGAIDQTWSDMTSMESAQNKVNWFEGAMCAAAGALNPPLAAFFTSLGLVNAGVDLDNDFTAIKNIMNDQNMSSVRVSYQVHTQPLMDGCTIEWKYYNVQTGELIYTRFECI